MAKIDETDMRILGVLEQNSKLSSQKISRKTGIPITTVHNRVRKLEKEGIIKGYTLVLDHEKLGRPLLAYILVNYDMNAVGSKLTRDELARKLRQIGEAERISYTTGRYDIVMVIRFRTIRDLDNLIMAKLRTIPGIGKTETFIVMEEIK
jgi:Lrp/AsnC family transcriptional regulator for asnA, asnC and gidA